MVVLENEFPKVDGDYIYGSEVNAFFQALKNSADIVMLTNDNLDIMDENVVAYKIADIFEDSDGHKDTVDTGNTTAEYDATLDIYYCALDLSTVVTEPSFETVVGWTYSELDGNAVYSGAQSATWSSVGSNSYKISQSSEAQVGDYAYITQSVNFDNINFISMDLHRVVNSGDSNLSSYSIKIGSTEISTGNVKVMDDFTLFYNCSAITGSETLSIGLRQVDESFNMDVDFYVDNIQTHFSDSFVQSDTITVTGTNTTAFVKPKYYYATPTGASITHQISLDDGSTWSTESDDGDLIDVSALSDTGNLICKTHLKPDGNGYHTPAILGWSVQMW